MMRRTQLPSMSARGRGVSLIEVLVTIVVVSLGLLGLAGLQAAGLRASQGAYYRAQAAQFAYDMADRIRANASPATASAYARAVGATAATGTTLQARDTNEWLARIASLPGGEGGIAVDGSNVTITVRWNDARARARADAATTAALDGAGADTATFVLQTRLWNN